MNDNLKILTQLKHSKALLPVGPVSRAELKYALPSLGSFLN